MPNQAAHQLLTALKNHQKILVVPTDTKSSDVFCAACALAHVGRGQSRKTDVWWSQRVPKRFSFLDTGVVASGNTPHRTAHRQWDAALALGSISHAPDNTTLYRIPIEQKEDSGFCEQLTHILKTHAEILITPRVAQSLLAGIITATNNFRNNRTHPRTLFTAAYLIAKGADNEHITRHLIREKPLSLLRLVGVALERVRTDQQGYIIVTSLREDDFARTKTAQHMVGSLVQELKYSFPAARFFIIVAEQNRRRFFVIHARQVAHQSALSRLFAAPLKNGSVVLSCPENEPLKNVYRGIIHKVQNQIEE